MVSKVGFLIIGAIWCSFNIHQGICVGMVPKKRFVSMLSSDPTSSQGAAISTERASADISARRRRRSKQPASPTPVPGKAAASEIASADLSASSFLRDHKQSEQEQKGVQEQMRHVIVWNLEYSRRWAILIIVAILSSLISGKATSGRHLSGQTNLALNSLTGVRMLFCSSVILYHSGITTWTDVGAFFVLSGCGISLSRITEQGALRSHFTSPQDFVRFFWKRIMRIMPLYWFSLAASSATSQDISSFTWEVLSNFWMQPFVDTRKFFLQTDSFFNAQGLGYTWFLQTILYLYLMYPMVERLIFGTKKDRSPDWILKLVVACCLLKLLTVLWILQEQIPPGDGWWTYHGVTLYTLPFLRLPEFVLGALIPHFDSCFPQAAITMTSCTDVMALLMVGFVLLSPQTQTSRLCADMNVQCFIQAFFIWGLAFSPHPSLCRRLLSAPVLVWLGELTFGIYLFHMVLLAVFGGRWGEQIREYSGSYGWAEGIRTTTLEIWLALPLVFAVSVMLAWVAFQIVQKPSEKLVHVIDKKIQCFAEAVEARFVPCQPACGSMERPSKKVAA
jgi:peptidoglycan/LPS O-acetylase OafA/YrhL